MRRRRVCIKPAAGSRLLTAGLFRRHARRLYSSALILVVVLVLAVLILVVVLVPVLVVVLVLAVILILVVVHG